VLGRGRADVGLAFATVAEVVAAPRAALGDAVAGDGASPFAVLFGTDGTTPSTAVVPWDRARRGRDAVVGVGPRTRVLLERRGRRDGGRPTEDEERAIAALDLPPPPWTRR
jgi:hypothetical protein